MAAVHHVDLCVSSLERSHPFYLELLRPLGWRPFGEIVGERGERVVYVGSDSDGASIGLREALVPREVDRYRVGMHHLAFAAPSRESVDERAAWLRRAEAEIESGPQEYAYVAGYYAVFFLDPDGLKLEICHVPREA